MSRNRTIMRTSTLLAGVLLASGCGDGDSATGPVPDPHRPTTLTVSPFTAELTALGATVQLTAEVRSQNAELMPAATVTWSSSSTAVAAVDQSGLVTAVSIGTAAITARAGSASGSAGITVTQTVESVRVSPIDGTIGSGETLRLSAEAFDENGHAVAGAEFSWESSDPSVATVDASGLVTGADIGVATITARAGGGRGTAAITVADAASLAARDRIALVAFYHATDGPNWARADNWLTDAPTEDWHGVRTDGSGRVVWLILGAPASQVGGRLSGPIPPEIGNLTSLQRLSISGHDLSGPIPPELGNLSNLEILSLARNNLTGVIPPEIGNLTSLRALFLTYNELSGPIPPELGNLSNLENLWLYNNNLTGPIPPELGNLTSLRWLRPNDNELSGPIPPELGNLSNLERLYLDDNNLTGPIPPEIGNLTSLQDLNLNDNNLTGVIPQSFLVLTDMVLLYFGQNAGLCAPDTTNFRTWLQGIGDVSGPFCAAVSSTSNSTGPLPNPQRMYGEG